jgi:hypothetical protein
MNANQTAYVHESALVFDVDLLAAGPGVDAEIGHIIDPDWEGLDDPGLLEAFVPRLLYDSQETYFADAVDVMTNSYVTEDHTNELYVDDSLFASSDPDAAGYTLTSSFLGSIYIDTTVASDGDHLNTANDYRESDAATMHAMSAYGNLVYGHVLAGPDDTRLLQYWFFYYDNPKQFFGVGDHEGDWEGIQVVVDDTGYPVEATYSQHNKQETCEWTDIQTTGDGRPIVYVAEGSHANYFDSGEHSLEWHGIGTGPFGTDEGDGANTIGPVDPMVEDIDDETPGWVGWPGLWGGSESSPQGPAFHGRFDSEGAADWISEGARACTVS